MHFFAAGAVVAAAAACAGTDRVALAACLCIAGVLTAEMFNSSAWSRWPRPSPAKATRTWALRWISGRAAVLAASDWAAAIGRRGRLRATGWGFCWVVVTCRWRSCHAAEQDEKAENGPRSAVAFLPPLVTLKAWEEVLVDG